MECNQLVLSGAVTEIEGLRYTPAGVPHYGFVLEHRSRQEEAGVPREVVCRIRVEARGQPVTDRCQNLAVNDRIRVTGFLSRAYYKEAASTRLVLHAQQLELKKN